MPELRADHLILGRGVVVLHFGHFDIELSIARGGDISSIAGGITPPRVALSSNPLGCVLKWCLTKNVPTAITCNTYLQHK